MKNGKYVNDLGETFYYVNDELHRPEEEGPAYISDRGCHEYYKHGKLHRLNGPAIDYDGDGYGEWYINGNEIPSGFGDSYEEDHGPQWD